MILSDSDAGNPGTSNSSLNDWTQNRNPFLGSGEGSDTSGCFHMEDVIPESRSAAVFLCL